MEQKTSNLIINGVLRAKSGFEIKLKKGGVLCMPMEDWSASDRATAAAVY
jgi:hypothetical protein